MVAGVSAGAHVERQRRERIILAIRQIHEPRRPFAQFFGANIPGDADDLDLGRLAPANAEAAPDRIRVAEEVSGERFVHDCDTRRPEHVCVAELPSRYESFD